MPYGQIDCKVRSHPKHLQVGAEVAWLWLVALLYSIDHTTDGYLSDRELRQLPYYDAHGHRLNAERAARRLAHARLLDRSRGGWKIHDFQARNMLRRSIERVRTGNQFRKLLYAHPKLVKAKRAQAKDHCECCGKHVSWTDRRSHAAASFAQRNSRKGITLPNIYVTCRQCVEEGRTPRRRQAKEQGESRTSSRTRSRAKSDQALCTDVLKYRSTDDLSNDQVRTDPSVHPDPSISTNPLKSSGYAASFKRRQKSYDKPDRNVSVITKIVHEVLTKNNGGPPMRDADIAYDVKQLCADRDIAYDSEVVGRAIDSAQFQQKRARA